MVIREGASSHEIDVRDSLPERVKSITALFLTAAAFAILWSSSPMAQSLCLRLQRGDGVLG
jgi:hypothetical protein